MFKKLFLNLFYRKKASGIIINKKKEALIVQLTVYKKSEWNFAGGGIEKGENEEKALLRELSEELGTNKFTILKEGEMTYFYNWPIKNVMASVFKRKRFHLGQNERFFLVEFTGEKSDIRPNLEEKIRKAKWVKINDLKNYLIFPDQWDITKRELKSFGILN